MVFNKLRKKFWEASFIVKSQASNLVMMQNAFCEDFADDDAAGDKLRAARFYVFGITRDACSDRERKAIDSISEELNDCIRSLYKNRKPR